MITTPPIGIERARWLQAYLLNQPLEGYERSIKLVHGQILNQRFLGGIAYERIKRPELLAICHHLGMPQPLFSSFVDSSEVPDIVHFGYEGSAQQEVFKIYLEFSRRALQPSATTDFILHRAYKWDARNPMRQVVATYRCTPGLNWAQQRRRIDALLGKSSLLQPIGEMLTLAENQGVAPPMYLEVMEEGNPRLSFDLNLHSGALTFSPLIPVLLNYSQLLGGIPASEVEDTIRPLASTALGHLSAGVSRDGQNFLTLYYDPFD